MQVRNLFPWHTTKFCHALSKTKWPNFFRSISENEVVISRPIFFNRNLLDFSRVVCFTCDFQRCILGQGWLKSMSESLGNWITRLSLKNLPTLGCKFQISLGGDFSQRDSTQESRTPLRARKHDETSRPKIQNFPARLGMAHTNTSQVASGSTGNGTGRSEMEALHARKHQLIRRKVGHVIIKSNLHLDSLIAKVGLILNVGCRLCLIYWTSRTSTW